MKLLYFHGGPGFNANPELNILKILLMNAGFEPVFWQEPSDFRTNGWPYQNENAFQNLLDSAVDFFERNYNNEPVVVVTHSFGCFPGLYLLNRYVHCIKHYITVTPGYCLQEVDKNIFTLNIKALEASNNPKAEALKNILDGYTGNFDDNTMAGYYIVAQNPNMFNNYWVNKQLMQQFLSFYAPPLYAVDVNAFINVRKTWHALQLQGLQVAATAIFGDKDQIISIDREKEVIANIFSNYTCCHFDHSSHFPHMEETEKFLAVLQNAAAK